MLKGDATEVAELSNPVVEVALKGLTSLVNLSSCLAHPSDRGAAIDTFRILKANGERFDPSAIRAWAARNGEDASELAEVAAKIDEGRRLRGDRMLRKDAIDHWRTEAAKGDTPG